MNKFKFTPLASFFALFCVPSYSSTWLLVDDGSEHIVNDAREYSHMVDVQYGILTLEQGGSIETPSLDAGWHNNPLAIVNITEGANFTLRRPDASDGSIYRLTIGNFNYGELNIKGSNSSFTTIGSDYHIVGRFGGIGVINITDGGQFVTSGSRYGQTIRVSGGSTINVSGQGSLIHTDQDITLAVSSSVSNTANLFVTDYGLAKSDTNIVVGWYGAGKLVVNTGGTVTAPRISISGDADTSSRGTLIIGSEEGDAPTAAGSIITNSINFGVGNGRIILNHTDNGYIFATPIRGQGHIDVLNGTTFLTGDNREFQGQFSIAPMGILGVSNQEALGANEVNNNGTFLINTDNNNNWTLTNSVIGTGELIKQGNGNLTLTDSMRATGNITIRQGTLFLGNADNPFTLTSNVITTEKNSTLISFGDINGNIQNNGIFMLGDNTTSNAMTFTVNGDLDNSGTVFIGRSDSEYNVGNKLVVNGDYIGSGGMLHFNAALEDDNTLSNMLIINGDSSGQSLVMVSNLGGHGDYTINGIPIIQVSGQSDAEFIKSGRIVAGIYDYNLIRGDGENYNHWYLSNLFEPGGGGNPDPDDGDEEEDEEEEDNNGDSNEGGNEDNNEDNNGDSNEGDNGNNNEDNNGGNNEGSNEDNNGNNDDNISLIRPETGIYSANLAAANTLFNTRLHDRQGENHYINPITGKKHVTSMWLRQTGGHIRERSNHEQLRTQSNRYVVQLGGDIARWSSNGNDQYHLGVMAGYANQHSTTRNHLNNNQAKGSIKGYSAGLYGTWLENSASPQGAYADSWLLYNWFNNSVKGDDISDETYRSKGITASLEGGYTWLIGQPSDNESVYIQPKAQAIWMGVKANEHTESSGTKVTGEGHNNIQTRLGVRLFAKHENVQQEQTFQPFVETNWIYTQKAFGVKMDGEQVFQAGTKNIGEVKVGVEGKLSKNTNVWSNASQQIGGSGYSSTSVMLGAKFMF